MEQNKPVWEPLNIYKMKLNKLFWEPPNINNMKLNKLVRESLQNTIELNRNWLENLTQK